MMDEPGKENMNRASRERDRATGVTLTLDGGMGTKAKTKARLKDGQGMAEVLVAQASSITHSSCPSSISAF